MIEMKIKASAQQKLYVMRAERLTRKFGHSKSFAFCILVEKYNQYKKGSLRFGREEKLRLLNPALRIAKPLYTS